MIIISGNDEDKLKQILSCKTGEEIITREELLEQHEKIRLSMPGMVKEMHDKEMLLFGEIVTWKDLFEARCPVCGAEINNDSLVCSQCDDDVYFPIDMGE